MEENKKVDVFSKKRPTVNELKTEVIRLSKDLDKSNTGLNHYKCIYEKVAREQENLINKCSKLVTSNNFLEANNKSLKNTVASLEADLAKIKKDCEEFKARNQYNSSAFIIAAIIALGAIITMILRLV